MSSNSDQREKGSAFLPTQGACLRLTGLVLLLLVVGYLSACTSWKVKKAFEGEYTAEENNRLIGDYCQTCHIHSGFSAGTHLDAVPQEYNRKVFRYATECRVCHFLEINSFTEEIKRKTRRPREANKGEFRDFEIDTMRDQKERLTREDQEEKKKASEELKNLDEEKDKLFGLF